MASMRNQHLIWQVMTPELTRKKILTRDTFLLRESSSCRGMITIDYKYFNPEKGKNCFNSVRLSLQPIKKQPGCYSWAISHENIATLARTMLPADANLASETALSSLTVAVETVLKIAGFPHSPGKSVFEKMIPPSEKDISKIYESYTSMTVSIDKIKDVQAEVKAEVQVSLPRSAASGLHLVEGVRAVCVPPAEGKASTSARLILGFDKPPGGLSLGSKTRADGKAPASQPPGGLSFGSDTRHRAPGPSAHPVRDQALQSLERESLSYRSS